MIQKYESLKTDLNKLHIKLSEELTGIFQMLKYYLDLLDETSRRV